MNIRKKLLIASMLGLGINTGTNAQQVAPFHPGDKIAYLGDSITDGGHYHSYIWLYYMTHLPNTRISIMNAGIGGDNVKQMTDRFETDVLTMKPNVVLVTWGMNDTGYFDWYKSNAAEIGQKAIDTAEARYNVLDKKLKQHPEIKKIFILGSPYDETTKSNKNNLYPKKSGAFESLIKFQEETAKRNGWEYVDFEHPMLAINAHKQQTDSLFSLTPNDRIHPDNEGHMVMAYLFLKTQGFANQVVADFSVNAKTKEVKKAVNCKISNVTGTNENLSFDYLANSLPYPLDTIPQGWGAKTTQAGALKLVPFTKEFNTEQLAVKGLKNGNYKLSMDGEVIGQWSSKDIEAGINLADQYYTPEYQQAIQIREMNEERWQIEQRFRKYAFIEFDLLKQKGLLYADNRAALDTVIKESKHNGFVGGNRENYTRAQFKSMRDAWHGEMDALVNEIYAINKPKTHKVTLELVK